MRTDPTTQAAILALIPGSVPVGTWIVRAVFDSTQACTMLDTREAHLPAGTLPEDRLILIHEQGHVRWDLPSDQLEAAFPAIRMPYVAAFYLMLREWVVDARLTEYVEDIRPSTNLKDWTTAQDPSGLPLDAIARIWMQWYYRVQHPAVCQEAKLHVAECWSLIDSAGQKLLADAYREVMADLLDDTISERWSITLAGHFAPPPPPPQPARSPSESRATRQARQKAEQEAEQQEAQAQQARCEDAEARSSRYDPKQALAEAEAEPQGTSSDAQTDDGADSDGLTAAQRPQPASGPDGSKGGGSKDVTSILVHNHLDARRAGKRIKDPVGMKTSGSVPTHTEYLRMGGAIFKESPKPSGAILLDVSASMDWSEEQLQEAIRLAPNLVVAGYAYGWEVGPMLCVIARGGRTSQSLPCASRGCNDGTDIAALLWLAKQPEPRVIVSDGAFYGRYSAAAGQPLAGRANAVHWSAVCVAIMKRHRIIRVTTMADAISWLKGRLTPASAGADKTPCVPSRRRH